MPKPDLKFIMDNDGQPLLGGGVVRGELAVACPEAVTCAGIKVTLDWSAHGRGNRHTVVVATLTFPGGSWTEGQQLGIPLSFAVPNGPASYQGRLLEVDWRLRAELDLPGGTAAAVQTLVVNANPTLPWEGPQQPLRPRPEPSLRPKSLVGSGLRAVWLVFAAMGVLVLGLAGTCGAVNMEVDWGFLLFAPVFLFLAVSSALAALWRGARSLKVGDVIATVAQTSVAPGEALMVSVDVSPRFDVDLEGAFVILRYVEVVMSGSANGAVEDEDEDDDEAEEEPDALAVMDKAANAIHELPSLSTRTRHVHKGREFKVPFAEAQRIAASALWTKRVAIPLPAEAVPSFACPDNALRWEAEVRLEVRRAPDWFRTIPFEVRPNPPS